MIGRKRFFLILFSALILAGGVLLVSAKNFSQVVPGCQCVNLETATGEFDGGEKQAFFEGLDVSSFLVLSPEVSVASQQVMGESSGGEKWIEIDLSEQKLRAWEGSNLFLETLISSGKSWTPTITGEFQIWSKFQYAKMSGGTRGTKSYYYLPNVPYIMYFHKDFALHGTYWHSNFGTRMSHGCVNLPTPMAEKLFYWSSPNLPNGKRSVVASSDNPGTRVVVHQ